MILIGISGKKQSGKDTVAEFIKELIPHKSYARLNFADALKREVSQACNMPIEAIERDKQLFRPVLQWWGTDFRRNMVQEDYWVRQWEIDFLKYRNEGTELLICTDVRFINEANIIKSYGGILFRVDRKHTSVLYDDRHDSETALDCYHHFDDFIKNDSSLEVLQKEVEDSFENWFLQRSSG